MAYPLAVGWSLFIPDGILGSACAQAVINGTVEEVNSLVFRARTMEAIAIQASCDAIWILVIAGDNDTGRQAWSKNFATLVNSPR